jgi:hypothetical protein
MLAIVFLLKKFILFDLARHEQTNKNEYVNRHQIKEQ